MRDEARQGKIRDETRQEIGQDKNTRQDKIKTRHTYQTLGRERLKKNWTKTVRDNTEIATDGCSCIVFVFA